MDFTFSMFVLSCGFLIGSYFIYWHIESIITDRCVSLLHDIESLFDASKSLLRKDFDAMRESLEILKKDYGNVMDVVLEEVKNNNSKALASEEHTTPPKPARKTSMKVHPRRNIIQNEHEKISSDDGD